MDGTYIRKLMPGTSRMCLADQSAGNIILLIYPYLEGMKKTKPSPAGALRISWRIRMEGKRKERKKMKRKKKINRGRTVIIGRVSESMVPM